MYNRLLRLLLPLRRFELLAVVYQTWPMTSFAEQRLQHLSRDQLMAYILNRDEGKL
jgi:hypothetical protein